MAILLCDECVYTFNMYRSFAFSSGGACHFQGFGEWKVRADDNGSLAIQQDLFGTLKDFGTFNLSPVDTASLWELIADAAFEQRASSTGPGIPDDCMMGFALSAQETPLHSIQLWASEAFADNSIKRLIEKIENLIEKCTGQKPVLR